MPSSFCILWAIFWCLQMSFVFCPKCIIIITGSIPWYTILAIIRTGSEETFLLLKNKINLISRIKQSLPCFSHLEHEGHVRPAISGSLVVLVTWKQCHKKSVCIFLQSRVCLAGDNMPRVLLPSSVKCSAARRSILISCFKGLLSLPPQLYRHD